MSLVSIVIPTFNPPEQEDKIGRCLCACLDSVFRFTGHPSFQVVVVANGCTQKTSRVLDTYGSKVFTVWKKKGLGFARACNEGIQDFTSEYVLLLNDDVEILPHYPGNWLDRLLYPMADRTVGIVGPHSLVSPETGNEFIVGFCMLVRRKVFQQTGLLDEGLMLGYGEDIDLCERARIFGWKIQKIGNSQQSGNLWSGDFPIYHQGEATLDQIEGAKALGLINSKIVADRKRAGYYSLPFYQAETVPML